MTQINNKLLALSHKLNIYIDKRSFKSHNENPFVNSEDLQHNLSPIVVDFLLELFVDPFSTERISTIIADYNAANSTDITIELFLEKGWLRYINETYVIPLTILSHLFQLEEPHLYNNVAQTPHHLEHQINCLLLIYQADKQHKKTSITGTQVNRIITKYNGSLSRQFFVDNEILVKNKAGNYYYNHNNKYHAPLINKICSLVWFRFKKNGIDFPTFRRFLRFIDFTGRWPNELNEYLSYEDQKRIHDFSGHLLKIDADLLQPEEEVRNYVYDSHFDRAAGIEPTIPAYRFVQTEPFKFWQEIQHYRFYNYDLFDHEESRNMHLLMVRFFLQFDYSSEHFQAIKDALKEQPNPFIKWKLLEAIRFNFPQVLPYFLTDHQLSPIVFEIIDKLEVNQEWYLKDVDYSKNANIMDDLRDELWMDAFNCYLDSALHSPHPEEFGAVFAAILKCLTEKVFSFNSTNYQRSSEQHKRLNIRYSLVIKALTSSRLVMANHYSRTVVKPLLSAFILPEIYKSLDELPEFPKLNEFLKLDTALIDIRVELLKMSNSDFSDNDVYGSVDARLFDLSDNITHSLFKHLLTYFKTNDLTVLRHYQEPEIRKAKRGIGDFGLEIIDLPYLFLHFYKNRLIKTLDYEIKQSLTFDPSKDKYDDHNRQEGHKIAIYLKILLVAYIGLDTRKNTRELKNLPVAETLAELQSLIQHYSLTYNRDLPEERRLDIFSSRLYLFSHDIYHQPLVALLYQALNKFSPKEAESFIDSYFDDSKELDKLFTAFNRIDDKNIREILSQKITSIDADEFIDSAMTVTELETVLLEIVNSKTLYDLADPFLTAIEAHMVKRNLNNKYENLVFIFKIKLLLALKRKDSEGINKLEVPTPPFNHNKLDEAEECRKRLFIGLDKFYNTLDYEAAVKIFQDLNTMYPKNTEYAFYLYFASTLNSLQNNEVSDAKIKWDTFKEGLTPDEKDNITAYYDQARSMDLIYYLWENDDINFDLTISTLPEMYLYQEHLIIPIYKKYLSRNLVDVAFDYLSKAINYLKENGIIIPSELEDISLNAVDDKLIEQLNRNLSQLSSLSADNIPLVIPGKLNGKRRLSEFILGEIISGLKIMRKKIKAVENIVNENHFNDVFLSTLRLRLAVWGWEIADQERTGQSGDGGVDAGEADIVIKSGGNDIAMVEALKLKGRNFTNLEKHVLKCQEYIRDLEYYYLVVYYHGKRNKWDSFKASYRSDIGCISYPNNWDLNSASGFTDLNNTFPNTENMYIGRTVHGTTKIQLYHIIIDLSMKK